MPAATLRLTVTAQALNDKGEAVGDAVREEREIPVHALVTFDPGRRVVAMAARDLGEAVGSQAFGALTRLAGA